MATSSAAGSRSESRQLSAQTETVCVKESLDSILGLLNSTFIKRQLEVRKVYAEEELLAVVDPRHLKQILFNLLHNSSKFTADGGQITVMTRSNFPKHEVAIEVRDTGCGIDRSRINEIFDPYSRAARSEDHEGFGLGLAVCKALIELNGGEIRVESEPGVGSSFQVTFRRAERERAIKATKIVELPNDNLPLASQNFLLVGVPPGVADSMAALIRALGGAVEQVQAAKDAVQALGDRQFSAIMVDQEPGEEKAEPIAQALKANHLNDVTSLIVSTNDQAVADQALKSGADQAILKPVSGQGLIEVLLTSSKTQLPH
ncbi:MAG: hypothetical protein DCC75_13535 [Proteobacteria bacterium]|nr:MAG: hypothetical protein DCC75_13535 [Pseudomonadota bacterium]